jgi:tungstate transport system substrate-binding protein
MKDLLMSKSFLAPVRKAVAAIFFIASGAAMGQTLLMASTTSTEQSGLFAHLLPAFKTVSGLDVKVVAVGTGQAIDMGRRGDADVLFVHDQVAEEKLVQEGHALRRLPVMYNDFVLVGPAADPAGVRGQDIAHALRKLFGSPSGFVSRGDRSGTHAAELRFWKLAGLEPQKAVAYKECGCGMGPALNIATASNAYTLTDRGTWLNFRNRGDLAILVEGDKQLFNQYGVLAVNPALHPHVNVAAAGKFVDWVTSPAGQGAIAAYKIGGEQLFFPNAKP